MKITLNQPIRLVDTLREGAGRQDVDPKSTDSRSPLERSCPIHSFPARLPLLDHAGEFLGWVSPAKALELERKYGAVFHGTKRKVRAVQLVSHRPGLEDQTDYKPSGPNGRKFSHNHETDQNPAGVWTLVNPQTWPGAKYGMAPSNVRGFRGRRAA